MSPLGIALIVFVCVFGGALLGMLLRAVLPEHHVSEESKDVVKVVTGLIATLSALVLGLLIASAKSSFDAVNEGFRQSGAKIILLDRALAQYGPETRDLRELLRRDFAVRVEQIWTQRFALNSQGATAAIEGFQQKLRASRRRTIPNARSSRVPWI